MKVILTGSTGSVGSAVLQRCIDHPSVTEIVALTRRPLDITNAKLKNIIHKDFSKYDKDVLEQLEGAQACIWYVYNVSIYVKSQANRRIDRALGSPSSGKEVHVDYTMTAVNAFLTSLVPKLKEGTKFKFVYTSGGLVPYLESNALFFLGPLQKLLGSRVSIVGTTNRIEY